MVELSLPNKSRGTFWRIGVQADCCNTKAPLEFQLFLSGEGYPFPALPDVPPPSDEDGEIPPKPSPIPQPTEEDEDAEFPGKPPTEPPRNDRMFDFSVPEKGESSRIRSAQSEKMITAERKEEEITTGLPSPLSCLLISFVSPWQRHRSMVSCALHGSDCVLDFCLHDFTSRRRSFPSVLPPTRKVWKITE